MNKTQFGIDQIGSPPPLWWRRFERAYIIVLAPGIAALLESLASYQGWGPEFKTLVLQVSIFSVAIVKAFGVFLGSGEEYPDKG